MIRILAQRVALIDKQGNMKQDWFRCFSDIVDALNKKQSYRLGSVDVTGTTDETSAGSFNVQVGNSGTVILSIALSTTSNANTKTVRVKVGGQTAVILDVDASTSKQSAQIVIFGRGANDQYSAPVSLSNMSYSGGGSTTANLSESTTIEVTLQLGNSADTITSNFVVATSEGAING